MEKVNEAVTLTPENLQEEVKRIVEAAKAQVQPEANVTQAVVTTVPNKQVPVAVAEPAPVAVAEQVAVVTNVEPTVSPEPTVVAEANQAEVATEQATGAVATPVEATVVEGPVQSDAPEASDTPVISQQEMQELRQSPLWQKATMANKQALVAMIYENNKPGALEQMAPEIKDKLISANVELIDAFNEAEEEQKKEEELFLYAQALIGKYGEELKETKAKSTSSSSSSSSGGGGGSSSSNVEWYEIAGGVAAGILGAAAVYYGGKALYEWGVGSLVDSELDSFDSLSFS